MTLPATVESDPFGSVFFWSMVMGAVYDLGLCLYWSYRRRRVLAELDRTLEQLGKALNEIDVKDHDDP